MFTFTRRTCSAVVIRGLFPPKEKADWQTMAVIMGSITAVFYLPAITSVCHE